jgi:hypothetical protein
MMAPTTERRCLYVVVQRNMQILVENFTQTTKVVKKIELVKNKPMKKSMNFEEKNYNFFSSKISYPNFFKF